MDNKNILEVCEDTNPKRVCFFAEKWAEKVHWMRLDDEIPVLIMPNFDGLRFNYCPTCGAYIREVEIKKKNDE